MTVAVGEPHHAKAPKKEVGNQIVSTYRDIRKKVDCIEG